MRTNASRHIFALAAALCLAGLSPIAALAQGQPPQSSNAAQVPASVPAPTPPLAAGQSKVIPTSFDLRKAVEYGLANNPTMVSARAQLLGSEYAQNAAMSDGEVAGLNIPTGAPLVYTLDDDLRSLGRRYLGDPEAVAAAARAVAEQASAAKG